MSPSLESPELDIIPLQTLLEFISNFEETRHRLLSDLSTSSTPSTSSSATDSSSRTTTPATSISTKATSVSPPEPNTNSIPTQNPKQEASTAKMPFRNKHRVVQTRTTKPTLMTRLRGRHAKTQTVKTTTKTEPALNHHHHTHGTHATHTTHPPVAARRSRWGGNRRVAHGHGHGQPVVQHRRHASLGDKVSGAMMKLRGSLTRRPGLKAAGTRRMHGTDGRGSHHVY